MQRWDIDYDYLNTLGIKVIKGRNFSEDFGTDTSAVILNEKAVKQLGLTDALNQKLYTWVGGGRFVSYNIIGVVKDFNFESLHQDIGPLCFVLRRSTGFCSFKISVRNAQNILNEAAINWRNFSPGLTFSYSFLDDSFNDLYKSDRQIGLIALLFSGLAIAIACLGLFGLAAFMAEQKTKEIGIRKALGASVTSIFYMLSKEFLKWILIANVLALPIAYYSMNKWLEDFAYRIDISWWVFALSGGIALLIALATVSFQAIKAAVANPIESLRYE